MFIKNRNIKWTFNKQAAPWTGRIFGRLVKSVKQCLKKILGKAKVNFDEMNTILINIQNVLNNRYLIFCYDDLTTPLVPNHLIYGCKIYNININDDTTTYDENATETRRCRHVQYLINSFWKQRQREYLRELREKQQKQSGFNSKYKFSKDDIVLIQTDKYNRTNWKMGRVTKLSKGRDANLRAGSVEYVNNDRKVTITRPINKLYPVELNNNEAEVKLKIADEKDIPSVKTG